LLAPASSSVVRNESWRVRVPEPYYQDDFVTIYKGDCRALIPTLDFGAIVSDPPYGMAYEHGARKGGVKLGHDGASIVGDQEPFDPAHLLVPGVPTILWGGNHFADKLPASARLAGLGQARRTPVERPERRRAGMDELHDHRPRLLALLVGRCATGPGAARGTPARQPEARRADALVPGLRQARAGRP
jgi:hypothetical protein